jgi:hypothetical protein
MEPEKIIKEHRRWSRWLESQSAVREGNLVLTNRRLLFLNRIGSSPEVSASIKKLADSPMEQVLNHAFTLHSKNIQIPLSQIKRIGVGIFSLYPYPRFCLTVSYYPPKSQKARSVAFQFRDTTSKNILKPQLIEDFRWAKTIKQVLTAHPK